VIDSDRGGQITYHGPGQLICYLMIDLRRSRQGIRQLVSSIEQCVIDTLETVGIESRRRAGAPGVYVGERKIAALGLRVRNGCTYHGLSLNLNMDKAPFGWIDPCGMAGLEVVNVADLVSGDQSVQIIHELTARLARIPHSNHSPEP
jgi:lipoyl(octanoyl) transferase